MAFGWILWLLLGFVTANDNSCVNTEGHALGIDFGGSQLKAGIIDCATGALVSTKHETPTPKPSTPAAVMAELDNIVHHFDWHGRPLGVTVPAVVRNQVVLSAANIDKSWIGVHAVDAVKTATGACSVAIKNDAAAAGWAEMQWGAGKPWQKGATPGVVFIITLGTGIGSVIFVNGHMLTAELGHLQFNSTESEKYAAAIVKSKENLSWREYGERVNWYLQAVETLFAPDVFIIGGGVSEYHDLFFHYLQPKAQVLPASFGNVAGIAGIACAALGTWS